MKEAEIGVYIWAKRPRFLWLHGVELCVLVDVVFVQVGVRERRGVRAVCPEGYPSQRHWLAFVRA
jgi:hypothetical protein